MTDTSVPSRTTCAFPSGITYGVSGTSAMKSGSDAAEIWSNTATGPLYSYAARIDHCQVKDEFFQIPIRRDDMRERAHGVFVKRRELELAHWFSACKRPA